MKQENINESSTKSHPSAWLWLAAALVVLGFSYIEIGNWLVRTWNSRADYSHGYLVVPFALILLWTRRGWVQKLEQLDSRSGLAIGLMLILAGLAVRVAGVYMRVLTLEALSMIPLIMGVVTVLLGRQGLRWAAPAVCFLVFMIPPPGFLAGQMSGLLQSVATRASTFSLQTLGIPAVAEGNVIMLSEGQIGVAEACSGLRMLIAFFALSVGACLVIDRTLVEKVMIAVTAIPIAIIANCIRIVVTGLAYEYIGPEVAEKFFHDVAGWLMMPLGFVLLLIGLAILDRLIVPAEGSAIGFGKAV